jgi:GT2 family glycosyltransferase
MTRDEIGIVAIGRNEGQRFVACLASMPVGVPVIYVDSGSTDGSVERARAAGVTVVELPTSTGFTAARARNAGWRALLGGWPDVRYVQFIDGDCTLESDWIAAGVAALESEPDLAVVFGRRKERHPEDSIYNAQCDDEWNVPIGEVLSCGGDALMRVNAILQAGGYSDDLIAGEEPDLCLRMRAHGWHIRRIDAPMTQHDADIRRFSVWWRRAKRAGHAFAEHVQRHGDVANPGWRREVRSTLFWAAAIPLAILLCVVAGLAGVMAGWIIGLLLALLYPVQWLRLLRRELGAGRSQTLARGFAWLTMLAKFAIFSGIVSFWSARLRGVRRGIIEYKAAA